MRSRSCRAAGAALLAAIGASAVAAAPAVAAARPGTAGHAPAPPAHAAPAATAGESYSLLASDGVLIGYGAALGAPSAGGGSPSVGVAATSDGQGVWIAEADGGVVTRGDAVDHGSMAGTPLQAPIVGIAQDPATGGYWLAAADGGVFAFHAPFFGSAGALRLHSPIVGIAAMPDGRGYRLVASDGGVFDYGDARYYGSTGALHLVAPIVGTAASPDGRGYWLVAADGGIFTFGDARYRGSAGAMQLNAPIVAMAPTPDGAGYWLAASDGGVFTYGDAVYYGAGGAAHVTVTGIVPMSGGYENPLRAITDLLPQRIDQGVDYGGGGPIYAIGDGVVLNTTNSGWPGDAFISYQLQDGPAKGLIVYVAENVVPAVQVGEEVSTQTVLGTLVNAPPNLETGWAAPPGTGQSAADAAGDWDGYDDANSIPTIYGENFSQLLASLGAPPGISEHPPVGTLPPGWPTW